MDDFEIIMPESPIKKEEIQAKNRKMFTDDLQKNGMLAKALVFTKQQEPLGAYELQIFLQKYYKVEYDKTPISRSLKKLNQLGLLHSVTSGELLMMPRNDMNEMHSDSLSKFYKYLEHIPKQFHKQYTGIIYYWVSNGEGHDYLEWCCNLLGFEVKKK